MLDRQTDTYCDSLGSWESQKFDLQSIWTSHRYMYKSHGSKYNDPNYSEPISGITRPKALFLVSWVNHIFSQMSCQPVVSKQKACKTTLSNWFNFKSAHSWCDTMWEFLCYCRGWWSDLETWASCPQWHRPHDSHRVTMKFEAFLKTKLSCGKIKCLHRLFIIIRNV